MFNKKKVACSKCNGYGFISHYEAHEEYAHAWSEECAECNGQGYIEAPETNGDKIRKCTNKELAQVIYNLDNWSIYSGGENNRLLNKNDPKDMLLWLNKSTDLTDMATIFNTYQKKE